MDDSRIMEKMQSKDLKQEGNYETDSRSSD